MPHVCRIHAVSIRAPSGEDATGGAPAGCRFDEFQSARPRVRTRLAQAVRRCSPVVSIRAPSGEDATCLVVGSAMCSQFNPAPSGEDATPRAEGERVTGAFQSARPRVRTRPVPAAHARCSAVSIRAPSGEDATSKPSLRCSTMTFQSARPRVRTRLARLCSQKTSTSFNPRALG